MQLQFASTGPPQLFVWRLHQDHCGFDPSVLQGVIKVDLSDICNNFFNFFKFCLSVVPPFEFFLWHLNNFNKFFSFSLCKSDWSLSAKHKLAAFEKIWEIVSATYERSLLFKRFGVDLNWVSLRFLLFMEKFFSVIVFVQASLLQFEKT